MWCDSRLGTAGKLPFQNKAANSGSQTALLATTGHSKTPRTEVIEHLRFSPKQKEVKWARVSETGAGVS